jgi:RNA polymerase-binding protein DksA
MVESREWLKNVQKELEKRKVELEADLNQVQDLDNDSENNKDLGDQAFSSSMDALRNSLQDARYKEYTMIIKALEAIADGTYGVCIDCGNMISEKRLNSYPNASRCLKCQESLEENK